MKKHIAFLLSLLLIISATVLFTACKPQDNPNPTEYPEAPIVDNDEPEIADTDIVLASNGTSEYKILIAQDFTWQDSSAASELRDFFAETTGYSLPIVYEDGLSDYSTNQKWLSIGKTTLFNNSGIVLDFAEYGEDGYKIKRVDNTVLICSAGDYGVQFGVYGFLLQNLKVKFWGYQETTIVDFSDKTVMLKDFDYTSIPDFDNRALGMSYEQYPAILENRLGLNNDHGKNWMTWCHTYFQLLPKSVYLDEHPDWYTDNGLQLCLTNEGMIEELIKVIKQRVLDNDYITHGLFMIGQEDHTYFCNCAKCSEEARKYGGNAGVMMRFINKIADVLNPWMEETFHGEKTMKWITFAYQKTVDAPVVKDSDGNYVPADTSVIAHENVGVMLAPLQADWSHSLLDGVHNNSTKAMIEGWAAIKPEFYIYTYNVVFDNQLIFMDSYSYLKESYQIFKDINAKFIFDQGNSFISLPFYEMSAYVRSRLLWNVNADVEKSISEFMTAFYKDASEEIYEYLDLLRTRYKLIEAQMEANGQLYKQLSYVTYNPEMVSQDYWPREWLENVLSLFDKALEKANAIENETVRQKVVNRVKALQITPIYLIVTLYKNDLTTGTLANYINTFAEACEVNGITCYIEAGQYNGKTVQSLLNDWMLGLDK